VLEFFMVLELLAFSAIPASAILALSARAALSFVLEVLIGVRFVGGDYFFG
jgi:hypothetical protein